MKKTKFAGVLTALFTLLFCISSVITTKAQTVGTPGVDPNALLLLDFENGDVSKWSTSGIHRGEKVSVDLMDAQNGDPVRFGRYAVKLNWDLTAAESNTTIACIYSPAGTSFVIPASPEEGRKIGMWIYASPECHGNIWFRLQQFSPPNGTPGVDAGPIAVFGNEIKYDDYWTGWKYHEFIIPPSGTNKTMGPPAMSTSTYGMFRFLQEKSGVAHQLTKGYFIIDNIRVTTAGFTEDTTRPTIDKITGNETVLDGATLPTKEVNLSADYSDTGESKINASSACFVVNGVMYKTGDKGFASNDATATLKGLKLRNGAHMVVMHVEDNFGNVQEKTVMFKVNDPDQKTTEVNLVTDDKPYVGNVFEMKVNTNNTSDVKELNITMELNGYGSVSQTGGIIFAPSVTEKSYKYDAKYNRLTINLKNDATSTVAETLATIKVNIAKNSYPNDVLRCTPISATAIYSDGTTAAFSLFTAFSKPVSSSYNLTVIKRVVGVNGKVLITDPKGNPVPGVTVYADTASGITGVDGVASFDLPNEEKDIFIYAEKDGKYSYTYVVRVIAPKLTEIPSAIRSCTTADPSTSKTFTWMSNPATTSEPSIIKIAKKSDGESGFVKYTGETRLLEFTATASSGIAKGSRVTVTGLEPGTTYIYQLGDDKNWTTTREFTTINYTDKFSFSAYGDLQATNQDDMNHWYAAATTLQAMEKRPFFSVNVGDIVDNDSRWDFHSYYSSLFDRHPIYANIDMAGSYGNHEYMGTPNANNIKFLNGHPSLEKSEKYNIEAVGDGTYAAEYGNMLLIILDWESKGGNYTALQRQTEQAKWLDEVLTEHADKVWKVISLHYEIPNADFTPTAMATLGPVLDKHNVQVVLCGHGHTFRRIQVKAGTRTPDDYTRTIPPVEGKGTLHWQLGGMRPSDGPGQRWIFGEVNGNTIKFTIRNGNNAIVKDECFTLTTAVEEYPVTFNTVDLKGTLRAEVDGAGISTGAKVAKGKVVSFTATPQPGYKVKEWKLNDESRKGEETTYQILGLNLATDVTVEFEKNDSGVESNPMPSINIYPSIFENEVFVTSSANSTLRVLDEEGVTVHTQMISGEKETVNLQHLSPGIYFCHVEKDGQAKTVTTIKK